MRAILILLALAALVLLGAMQFGFVKFDQTQTAQLPRLEGGQAPKFEVDTAKVSLGTENKTVEVPSVDVQKPGQ